MDKFIKVISGKKMQNLLLWLIVTIFEVGPFLDQVFAGIISPNAVWLQGLKIVLIAGAVYFNYLVLIPSFIKTKKYLLFVISNLISALIFSTLIFIISIFTYKHVNLHESSWEHHILFTTSLVNILVFIIGSTMVYFIKEWYKLKDIASKMILLEKEKIESEHQALKAQLNPHFLFNTLNNLYSLSIAKSDKAPQVILKLSELMSYVLYECKEEYIELKKEVNFLNDYIELEKLRSGKIQAIFNAELSAKNPQISPLLFIPFIENAFKHSRSDFNSPKIEARMELKSNTLYFYCKNTIGNQKTKIETKYQGVGIENVKKRLELIYPHNHKLEIIDKESEFEVFLEIDFNQNQKI
jgi:two-component system LytT family sensor kinase